MYVTSDCMPSIAAVRLLGEEKGLRCLTQGLRWYRGTKAVVVAWCAPAANKCADFRNVRHIEMKFKKRHMTREVHTKFLNTQNSAFTFSKFSSVHHVATCHRIAQRTVHIRN